MGRVTPKVPQSAPDSLQNPQVTQFKYHDIECAASALRAALTGSLPRQL